MSASNVDLGPLATLPKPDFRIEFSGGPRPAAKTRQQMIKDAMVVKPQIAEIVEADSEEGWKIVDSIPDKGLYLIHPDEEYLEQLKHLIGVVVDLHSRKVLVQSTIFTPVANSDTFEPNDKGDVVVTDTFGNDHLILNDSYTVHPKFEGKIIRIFKHGGIVYFSSPRKISVERSKVAGNRTLLEIYQSIGGPSENELFDSTEMSSPFVHVFIISTSETRLVNKLPFTNDLLVYKKTYRTDGSIKGSGDEESKSESPKDILSMGSIHYRDVNSITGGKAQFLFEHFIPTESVSQFLQNGFMGIWCNISPEGPLYEDPRTRLGEAVIVTYTHPETKENCQIEIRSTAYAWRFGMRDENPAVEHQFYILTSNINIDTNTTVGRGKFIELMPIYPQYDVDQMTEKSKQETIAYWPSDPAHPPEDVQIGYRQGRLYNVWVSLLMAVSYDVQSKVAPLYNKYIQRRDELMEWLQIIADEQTDLNTNIGPRAINLITAARRNAQTYPVKGQSVQQRVNITIRRYVKRERGDTMHRMLKIMDRHKFLASKE